MSHSFDKANEQKMENQNKLDASGEEEKLKGTLKNKENDVDSLSMNLHTTLFCF